MRCALAAIVFMIVSCGAVCAMPAARASRSAAASLSAAGAPGPPPPPPPRAAPGAPRPARARRPPRPRRRPPHLAASQHVEITELPPALSGANLEFIKQLNAKKEARARLVKNDTDIEDSVIEESVKSFSRVPLDSPINEGPALAEAPVARSAGGARPHTRLTTVSFSIVHEQQQPTSSEEPTTSAAPEPLVPPASSMKTDSPVVSEPGPSLPQVYSQPAKIYGEPAKFYSEPAKVYGEPAKVYGEPAKVYGEPAKVYGEPAKFYSQPASLHLTPEKPPWSDQENTTTTLAAEPTTTSSTPAEASTSSSAVSSSTEAESETERSRVTTLEDVEEGSGGESCRQENCKVGYVVEGRQYRKYRVEERTADGYLVGEYGVVRHEDGALRGVRYTADSDADPRLIYDALMKFLQL